MKSVISSKGQVTIPIEVRRRFGFDAGTAVQFEITKHGALLRKSTRRGEPHPVDAVYGRLHLRKPVDELLDEMRGPRPGRS